MAGYASSWTKITGNTIEVTDFTVEFSAIESAFNESTGHKHDGTADEGPPIDRIGDADQHNKIKIDSANNEIEFWIDAAGTSVQQLSLVDGVLQPITTNDVDLGTSTYKFKNLYLSGTSQVSVLNTGTVTSHLIPGTTDTYDLGGVSNYWRNLFLSGVINVTGYINSVSGTSSFYDISLSNGVASTLRPTVTNTYDIGSNTYQFQDLYICGYNYLYDTDVSSAYQFRNNDGTFQFSYSTFAPFTATIILSIDYSGNISSTGDYIRLATSSTPLHSNSDGSIGQIRWDSNYIYVCVNTNTWKRIAYTDSSW